jgi:hypothetical protein
MWLTVDICGTGKYRKQTISESCLAQSYCNNCHNNRQNVSVLSVASSVCPGQDRIKRGVEDFDAVNLVRHHIRFYPVINSHSMLTVSDTFCWQSFIAAIIIIIIIIIKRSYSK